MTESAPQRHTTPVLKKDQPDDSYKFQPLPEPTGSYPYHLSLNEILPEVATDKLVFHMAGDTGGMRNPDFQQQVALAMASQITPGDDSSPQFLYHLGDIVYHFGESDFYEEQFFRPYSHYPAPIVAIAGNHDADVNPFNPVPYHSLDAFRAVFCDMQRRPVSFSGETGWKSQTQPNVYWTLQTPLVNIIGLYSNVPKFGMILKEQRDWFINELKTANAARPGKALIICVHHAPFSADTNHGASLFMAEFLDEAFAGAGVLPDIVFSGHVHNYQHFEKVYPSGKVVPFIVAGSGGFDELHSIALTTDERFAAGHPSLKDVELKHYCETRHGFLKVEIEKMKGSLALTVNYYTLTAELTSEVTLEDRFTVNV